MSANKVDDLTEHIPTTRLPEALDIAPADPYIDASRDEDIRVSVEETLTTAEVEELYALYEAAFGPLRIRAAARHVLTHEEFLEEVTNPLVSKILARNRSGEIEGMMTVTNHLETVPWISPEYYRHQYPEHASRSAIYYLGFAVVRPSSQNARVYHKMVRRTADQLVRERAILAFDIARINNAGNGLAETTEKLFNSFARVSFDTVDVQTYYAVAFNSAR
ncbi:hypothetical protein [Millisia brevis]|uniref:hypothetical protein n=1 Tax=Millisia brevis TaxID=264148 RepID=UPI0008310D23|nr:hypothetical protein [Millisia brevis]